MNLKKLLPICYVHHIKYGFGYAFMPIGLRCFGYFEFGKIAYKNGEFSPQWGFKIVTTKHMHNCTWSGKY